MRLQRAIVGWAALLLLITVGVRPASAAVPASDEDPLFQWKRGWVETPQWGGRLGYVNGQGDLKVRLRTDPAGAWFTVARHVRSFQLLDWSLAVLGQDGKLFVAEGALNAPLEPVAENVCAFQKTLTRLGILQCDGTLLVKETVSGRPRAVAAGIEAFQILDDRAALRGIDGSLWVQQGGVVANFHKLADRVTSFQLERGWIAYLEPQTGAGAAAADTRLMIAEGSLYRDSKVTTREVARDVIDFEMEIRVEAGADFHKTLHLAVLSRDGVLKLGVGGSLPVELKEFDRGALRGLAWAGGRLAYLGADGLKVAHFGRSSWPERVDSFAGAISSFRMTTEGTLLFESDRGSPNLVDWRQVSKDAEPGAKTREEKGAGSQVMDASEELTVDGDAPRGVESSSIRPRFMRRPVQADPSSAGSRAVAVRFFSNVPQARPEAVRVPDDPQAPPLSQATAVPLYQVASPGAAGAPNGAVFVSQSVPASMVSGQSYPVSVTMRNSGTTTWSAAAAYRLGSQNPQDNQTWGAFTRVSPSSNVPPGGTATFSFSVRPPAAGSLNFQWRMVQEFVEWFGEFSPNVLVAVSAPGAPNAAVFVSQSVPASMISGQSYPVSVTMRNSGTKTWSAAASYRLGSQNPQDNQTWGAFTRVSLSSNVPPGGTATFSFSVRPPAAGSLNFQWRMVQDFVEWFGEFSPNVVVAVSAPGTPNAAVFVSQSVPASMVSGQSYPVSVTMRNSGTKTWTAAASYRLGSQNPQDNQNWGAFIRVSLSSNVPPGGNATFSFSVRPPAAGSLNFQWRMIQEFVEWFGEFSPNVPVAVSAAGVPNAAVFVSQSVPASMVSGQSYPVSVTMRNSGTKTWSAAAAYRLGSQNPQDNLSWGTGRVALPSNVAPGGTVTFSFSVKPPAAAPPNFQWRMVQENVEWFGDFSPNVLVSVPTPKSGGGAVAFYELYLPGATDHFYTTSAVERDIAKSLGFIDQGVAANVEPTQVSGTLPFWRFYSGSQSDHFYTTSAAEYDYVVANGFTYESIEGYIYSAQAAGTVPLYRLSIWNPSNNDLDHFYTTSDAARNAVVAQGWTDGGLAGYVWPVASTGAGDGAAFVSQDVPGLMIAGLASSVSITLRNTGSTSWTRAAGYQLSSQNPQDNLAWGLARVDLPGDVAPNATVTFTFAVAPAAMGSIPFQWRMARGGGGGGVFGAATQNVVVVVARNPRFPTGVTPYADKYIRDFDSIHGDVPPQTSVWRVPYAGRECNTPYLSTSACNPGVTAWARDPAHPSPLNPCLTGILMPENFSAAHERRNIGPDVTGRTWTPLGKNSYGLLSGPTPCVPVFGSYCSYWVINYWLIMSDPIVSVGIPGDSYCPADNKRFSWYPQGKLTREILPGEVTPDSYAMVLDQPDFRTPFRAYVPGGHKVDLDQNTKKGDLFWANVPPTSTSIPVLGATLFGGGMDGPRCFVEDPLNCHTITDRAMAQLTPNGWVITITGYMTGNDNIFRNTSDALADLGGLAGTGESSPTVEAIQNWLVANQIVNFTLYGHSLGAMDAALLYQRGFGNSMVLFSAPWVLPIGSLLPTAIPNMPARPVFVYSGVNDTISNMLPVFSGCATNSNTCRSVNGVNLFEIDTGGGFLTGKNPHDRCKYQAVVFNGVCLF